MKHFQLDLLSDDNINDSEPNLIESTEHDSLESAGENGPKGPVKYKEYCGAIHIHTT